MNRIFMKGDGGDLRLTRRVAGFASFGAHRDGDLSTAPFVDAREDDVELAARSGSHGRAPHRARRRA